MLTWDHSALATGTEGEQQKDDENEDWWDCHGFGTVVVR